MREQRQASRAVRDRARRVLAAAVSITAVALTSLTAVAQAGPGSSSRLVPTVWDCTNGDTLTFNLPPVVISPGAGPTVAPFPGFLVAQSGPVVLPLGTYVVLATSSSTSGPWHDYGQKRGLSGNVLDCGLEGAPVAVLVAHAG